MSSEVFSPGVVESALSAHGGSRRGAVRSVEVLARFPATTAEVARLKIGFADGASPVVAIGKSAAGAGLGDVRRELRFYERIAPLRPNPAPRFLGAWTESERTLLLTEDLGALGYALNRDGFTSAQLNGVVDTLVSLHACFWEDLQADAVDASHPAPSVTQSAQAWPSPVIRAHAETARLAAASFIEASGAELAASDRALLQEVLAGWEDRFLARTAAARSLTLIHADFHLLGNVFFATGDPRPKVIDWSELKPGLGPHDLAYCLISAPCDDRAARDFALLRRYWEGLQAAGVREYSWELCQWDYRFSLITNLFQSVLQSSATWFHKTADLIDLLDCRRALRMPAP